MAMEQLNPDLVAFAAAIATELVFAQVLIRRDGTGFELRHEADCALAADRLRLADEKEIRALAQFTAEGAFRPLKSAPNLRGGWRIVVKDERSLGTALSHLYPGAVADWFAARSHQLPVTCYRDFTSRQTGMYRITTSLDDATAAAMMRACCHQNFCLKHRLWTVGSESCDEPGKKSVIPCLEPCAVLLEFARKSARWQQQGTEQGGVAAENVWSGGKVECDFDDQQNPRRLRYFGEIAGLTAGGKKPGE